MNAIRTKAFRDGDRMAVHLPDDLGIADGDEVVLEKQADGWRLLAPGEAKRASAFKALRELPRPSLPWTREPIDVPDRPGL